MSFAMRISQYHLFLDQRPVIDPESCFTVMSSWLSFHNIESIETIVSATII